MRDYLIGMSFGIKFGGLLLIMANQFTAGATLIGAAFIALAILTAGESK